MTVFKMVEIVAIFLHLAPQAEWPPVIHTDTSLDTRRRQRSRNLAAEPFKIIPVGSHVTGYKCGNLLVFVRATETERQILKLGLDVIETQTVGQRSVEIVGLAGYLHLLFRLHGLKGSHVVEPVGQFYQNGPDVILHRVEQLTVIVQLLGQLVILGRLLGYDPDQECHVIAETRLDVIDGIIGVLHHVMQEAGYDRIGAKHQFLRRDVSHRYGMEYVRLARLALLKRMSLARHYIGAVNPPHILVGNTPGHDLEHMVGPLPDYPVVVFMHNLCLKIPKLLKLIEI